MQLWFVNSLFLLCFRRRRITAQNLAKLDRVENVEFKLNTQDKNLTNLNLELPVLEKEAQKSVVLDSEFEESVLEETEVESTESCKQDDEQQTDEIPNEHVEFDLPTQQRNLTSSTLDFTVLEARSLEDIDYFSEYIVGCKSLGGFAETNVREYGEEIDIEEVGFLYFDSARLDGYHMGQKFDE